jgi:hypothetical protein
VALSAAAVRGAAGATSGTDRAASSCEGSVFFMVVNWLFIVVTEEAAARSAGSTDKAAAAVN